MGVKLRQIPALKARNSKAWGASPRWGRGPISPVRAKQQLCRPCRACSCLPLRQGFGRLAASPWALLCRACGAGLIYALA